MKPIVVLTALNLEFRAIRALLETREHHVHDSGTVFEIGGIPGVDSTVVVAVVGEGNLDAGVLAERAIATFSPSAVLFVGIAGSLKSDVALGDVVVATKVYAYHGGKQTDEFLARPRSWDAPHQLEQLARHLDMLGEWADQLPEGRGTNPLVHFKPIAAGEVVLDSLESPTAQLLRRHYNDAAAVEMEAAGVAKAGHLNRGTPVLVVRGISDRADGGKASSDQGGWQEIAAANAAGFAVGLIELLAKQGPRRLDRRRNAPDDLPNDISDFTGRESELGRLDDLLEPCTNSVVISAVDGTAGVGKTTLAVHWAHRVKARFPDGCIHIDLQGYAPVPPVQPRRALGFLLQRLGVPDAEIPPSIDGRVAAYRDALAGRRVLILLDNAHTVNQVRAMLPTATSCLAVITSRSRLSGLAVRDGARMLTLDVLDGADSLALLRRIVGATRLDAEPTAASRLAELCGYLPLALRIAGVRLAMRPSFKLSDAVAELAEEPDRLDALSTIDDEHATVRSVFSWSYMRLDPDQQRAFRLLGLHRGPSLSGHAIAALTGSDVQGANATVPSLVALHLLEEDRPSRYRIHDLLRLYATELCKSLESPADRLAAVERILHWYVATATAADGLLEDRREDRATPLPPRADVVPQEFKSAHDALEWFDDEYSTIVDIAHQAAENGLHDLCWRLPLALWSFFQRRSRWTDWIDLQNLGLIAARAAHNELAEAWILSGLGDVHDDLEHYEEALSFHQQALALHRKLGNAKGEATALNNHAVSLDNLERYDEAIVEYRAVLALFEAMADRAGTGMVLNNLGAAYYMTGKLNEAADHYLRSVEIRREIADRYGEGMTLHNLGEVSAELGKPDEAIAWFEQAIAAHRAVGHLRGEARALRCLGSAVRERDGIAAARSHWNAALTIFEEVGDPEADEVIELLTEAKDSGGPVGE
ncbi:tetratricopeptide repeat protein [Amycolatopsis sp. DG1A-15b]|uniref:phosphorylase family protein n=1 Tax=Amycolatopsis sp. DG1A-15b TaxID=3052846 RepID=UPI00255C0FCB|nr:tetratricopeptide repeat protein [Amycolatopsis sp. DG1A-15b]WIX85828.1 tetratricopeptide repeat protein [Amycolatopsis sp. DG1A-15b]